MTPTSDSPSRTSRGDFLFGFSALYWTFFAAGLLWTLYLFLNSPGVLFHDELSHFFLSADAWQQRRMILSVWGRPFNTMLYMLPALFGFTTARAFSLALGVLTVLLTTLLARRVGVRLLFLVPVCLWFQPWFHDLTYTANTMIPFSLLLIAGVYAASTERYTLAALAFGLLPLTRHEGIALTGLWILFALYGRQYRAVFAAAAPMLAYNAVYYTVFGVFASGNLLNFRPTEAYGFGSWLHFVRPTIRGAGVPLTVLSLCALPAIFGLRAHALVFLPYAAYFLTHTIINRFGLFASGRYWFFLLPLAPAIALAATMGIEAIAAALHQARTSTLLHDTSLPKRALGMVVISTAVVCIIWWGVQTPPRPLSGEAQTMRAAAQWIVANDLSAQRVINQHPLFRHFYEPLDTTLQDWKWFLDWALALPGPDPRGLPFGAIIVWDRHYSEMLGGYYLEDFSAPESGWVPLASFGNGFAVVFQKQ